VIEL